MDERDNAIGHPDDHWKAQVRYYNAAGMKDV
jgi:hypothetical protein